MQGEGCLLLPRSSTCTLLHRTPSKSRVRFDFDFIECSMTTFLRAHSWLNWVDDEDEVGLKEKPEDTRYIKKITSKSRVRGPPIGGGTG